MIEVYIEIQGDTEDIGSMSLSHIPQIGTYMLYNEMEYEVHAVQVEIKPAVVIGPCREMNTWIILKEV